MRGRRRPDLLPTFEPWARLRPVGLTRPEVALGLAPYASVESALRDRGGEVSLTSGRTRLAAAWDGATVTLMTSYDGATTRHAGPVVAPRPDALALTLTGPVVTAWTRQDGRWTARHAVDLTTTGGGPGAPDVHDADWLADLRADGDVAGGFGQVGLRDLRVVTHADGTPYRERDGASVGPVLLTATSAGPGHFRTGHASVWALDPTTPTLTHRGDLFFGRPDRPGVYGDHAVHLVRDDDQGRWLVATSTWGDFDLARPVVGTTLATSTADLLHGSHVLATAPLRLPTDGFRSVGTWDPHLVRTDDGWLVTYVSARRFFRFHPVVAAGPTLDALEVRAAATRRRACEGPTLARLHGRWTVLASEGRDGRRGQRASYPVLDLDLLETGRLDAHYPSNIPWPTLVEHDGELLLVGFDATSYGGPVPGYGTHGDVVLQRALAESPRPGII